MPFVSGLFSRSSPWSRGAFKAEADSAAFDPPLVSEWEAAWNASPKRFEFVVRLGFVDPGAPLTRQRRIDECGQPQSPQERPAFVLAANAVHPRRTAAVVRAGDDEAIHAGVPAERWGE